MSYTDMNRLPLVNPGVTATPIQQYTATLSSSGTYVQLVASTSEELLLTTIAIPAGFSGNTGNASISIGSGGSGSEIVVATYSFYWQSTASPTPFNLPVPVLVPSGTRLAAKFTFGAAAGPDVQVTLYKTSMLAYEF